MAVCEEHGCCNVSSGTVMDRGKLKFVCEKHRTEHYKKSYISPMQKFEKVEKKNEI